jgi:hypothetical protein
MKIKKIKKRERDSHMRGIYEILGKEDETKICKICKIEKKIVNFGIAQIDNYNRCYTKNTCSICDGRNSKRIKELHNIFSNIKPDVCQICKKNKKLSPDHCHKTMAFRGWVCHDCNTTLGRMDDNPQFLINAIEYLQKDPIPDPPKQQLSLELEEFTLEKQNEMGR